MNKNIRKSKKETNKGVTGIDIVIAISVLIIFAGVISNLLYVNYKTAIDIQKTAKADAYATTILEKIDEKPYDSVTNDFYNNLLANNEIDSTDKDQYTVTLDVQPYSNYKINNDYVFKKVVLTLKYDNNSKTLVVSKLKVREIGV